MGDQNQASFQHDSVQTVTSVGNSWIICRSKSHAGRIYYFNTLSGEAAWNLSDQEIEKAKTRTKILESQSGGKFEGCPEPKDPPVDNNHSNRTTKNSQILVPSRVYNKQIINNQFSKPTAPPVVATKCSNCSSVTAIDSVGVNLPSQHNCNPNVWAIPPHHQIVIAPTTSPILNQLQTSVSVPCNNFEQRVSVQNTSLPLTHRFNQLQRTNKNFWFANGMNKRNNNKAFNKKYAGSPYYRKNNRLADHIDLRQKLTSRRKSNNNWNSVDDDNTNYQAEEVDQDTCDTLKIQIIKPSIEDVQTCTDDDQWLKENATVQGIQLMLDVLPLKQLVIAGSHSTWYIVADMGVLLNHINLINVIVNSDETCQLMVPDFLMVELQTKSMAPDAHLLNRAHHIFQNLSKQFTAGNAVLGKDPASDNSINDFCYKLAAEDHGVVLISSNIHWKTYKNSIITLSVDELKEILSKNVQPDKQSMGKIQIVIPNTRNIANDMDTTDSKSMSEEIQCVCNENELSETQTNSSDNFNNQKNQCKVDIGIQTDSKSSPEFSSISVNSIGVNTETQPEQNINERNEECHDREVTDSVEIPQRREIRLKRHVSHQPTTDNNSEKKQFKWRRKRNASIPYPNTADQKTMTCSRNTFNIEDKTKNTRPGQEISRTDTSIDPECTSYDPIDSSETSSSCFINKSLYDKVVIEETSTSGVISNSADSESMQSIKNNERIYEKNIYEDKDVCKCVMFEVESPVMEEHLRTRSDEWVSRFVQIMEEVLTQILQQNPAFFNRTLPPPWTLHEATECIKKKFGNDFDVKDASFRLTKVLFKISDGRGKISAELKPSEFMEMYSYGVYLVDALQSVLSKCEDLQTAADSLAKLLSDIQDPALDTTHTDSFMDCSHEPPADITDTSVGPDESSCATESVLPKSQEKETLDFKSPSNSNSNKEGRKYNLRSSLKNTTQDEPSLEKPVKFIRKLDIESNFFSSLNLQKKPSTTPSTHTNAINCATDLHNNPSPSKQDKVSGNLNNAEVNNTESQHKPEPKIIRHFRKCLEFEEKLKSNQKETIEVDRNDYSENYDEDDGYDYYDDYTHSNYDYYDVEGDIDDSETYQANKENDSHVMDKISVDENGYIKFKPLFITLGNEIQGTLLDVKSFCAKIIQELNGSKELSLPRKLEIKSKAEMARLHIDALSKSLNSIISREAGNNENKIHSILEEAGFRLDCNKSVEYRDMIEQFSKQANILLDAVNIVLEAVK